MRNAIVRWLGRLVRRKPAAHAADTVIGAARPGALLAAAGGTDRGKVRENNEDDFLCDAERQLFIVADGMGGHAAGDRASKVAVSVLSDTLSAERLERALSGGPTDTEALLREGLQRANDAIIALTRDHEEWQGMGSTAVIAILHDATLYVSNLGDSRAYLVRGGQAQPLTRDHSVAAVLMEQGQLGANEARSHPLRNQLTASLGLGGEVTPAFAVAQVQPEDRVVLCSDGVWDRMPDSGIARTAALHTDPGAAVTELISAANAAGGQDNVTAIVVILGPAEETADA
jgi:serine/threonine protein phosphatase PrpC